MTSIEPKRRLAYGMAVFFSFLALVIGITSVLTIQQLLKYDPFCDYPPQRVVNRIPGVEGPAARVTDDLEVVGTKCVTEEVEVQGSVQWITIDPGGSFVLAGQGVATRQQGIVEETFINTMPEEAREITLRLFDLGYEEVVWRIAGEETPVEGGVTQPWTTQNFKILPAE